MELARVEIWNPGPREAPLPPRPAEGQTRARPSQAPVDLKTDYLGFRLRSPLIACVSEDVPRPELAAAPIGAVFFGPVSEQALDREAWKTFSASSRGEQAPEFEIRPPLERPLERLRGWKASVETPVIAGIEAVSEKCWLSLAFALEQAGADALELFLKAPEEGGPSDPLRIIQLVSAAVRIPIAARISPGLTPLLKEGSGAMAQAGLKALVLFRPPSGLVPDLDRLEMRDEALLPGAQVFRLALPALGALADGGMDLGAAGPVASSRDVLGALLAGSRAVYVTPEPERLKQLEEALASWMAAKGFSGVESINATRRGS
jgi:dihydroorotate dehydrogenase